jgi:hypothetical protein
MRATFGLLRRFALGLLIGAAIAAAPPWTSSARAEGVRRALLVGVSDYPRETVGDLQLAGPKYDVALMIDTVERMGFSERDLTVLADGLDAAGAKRPADGAPTRTAILAAMAELAARSQAGDFVLLYFSGHGSQQPDPDPAARPAPKPDGLSEIFLPIDIGPWEDSVGTVKNALVDQELGRAVAAIRAKGASVWVVIDACHSGTMTRAGGDGVAKQVAPEALKIPPAALAAAKARAEAALPRTRGRVAEARAVSHGWGFERAAAAKPANGGAAARAATEPGGYVAFFAAYPDQLALQKNLPRGWGAGERRPHGVLTFHLAEAIRSGRAASFRDLAHGVMAGYDQFGQAPTPMFEGDLGASVPGLGGAGAMRFAATIDGERITLGGGVVDGLAVGAVVGLATLEAPETIRAFARVEAAGAARATAVPIERDGLRFEAALANESLTARLVEKAADFVFRVARPPRTPTTAEERAVAAALDDFAARPRGAVAVVDPAQAADLRMFVEEGRVWFVADDAEFVKSGRGQSPSIALPVGVDAATAAKLLDTPLATLAKARNLVRVTGLIGAGEVSRSVAVESLLVADPGGPGGVTPDDRDCPAFDAKVLPADARPFDGTTEAPRLGHCDVVWFRLTNRGTNPVDVTPLYVDGAGGVAYMGPAEGLRLDPGGVSRLVPVRIVTWSRKRHVPLPIGRERMLFLMVEVEGREALPADFRHLAQAAAAGIANRGAAKGPLAGLLEAAAFGSATRGGSAPSALGRAGVAAFGWTVVAPEEVVR